jgi:hypothetical protein
MWRKGSLRYGRHPGRRISFLFMMSEISMEERDFERGRKCSSLLQNQLKERREEKRR